MKNNFYTSLIKYLNITLKLKKTKFFFYTSIKNYYLTIKRFKFNKLYSPIQTINLLYSQMYFLNLLQNKQINKWFVFKLIKIKWI
jgi:hypothetical protein